MIDVKFQQKMGSAQILGYGALAFSVAIKHGERNDS